MIYLVMVNEKGSSALPMEIVYVPEARPERLMATLPPPVAVPLETAVPPEFLTSQLAGWANVSVRIPPALS